MKKPIYIPPRRREILPHRREILLAIAEFFTLLAFWGAILIWAVLFRALIG